MTTWETMFFLNEEELLGVVTDDGVVIRRFHYVHELIRPLLRSSDWTGILLLRRTTLAPLLLMRGFSRRREVGGGPFIRVSPSLSSSSSS